MCNCQSSVCVFLGGWNGITCIEPAKWPFGAHFILLRLTSMKIRKLFQHTWTMTKEIRTTTESHHIPSHLLQKQVFFGSPQTMTPSYPKDCTISCCNGASSSNTPQIKKTSWWFQPLWKILVQLDHLPNISGWKWQKYLSFHHLEKHFHKSSASVWPWLTCWPDMHLKKIHKTIGLKTPR